MNKESIRKDFSDKIYPSMVIRSQTEAIELLEKENEQLREEKVKLLSEREQLKKQKDDVVEYIKSLQIYGLRSGKMLITKILNKILRMLGEIDE